MGNFRVTYLTLACLLISLAVTVHSSSPPTLRFRSSRAGTRPRSRRISSRRAVFGLCRIITLFIILRYTFRFEQYMTIPILEKLAKLTFAISMVWTYLNLIEYASVWYGTDTYTKDLISGHGHLRRMVVGDEILGSWCRFA